MWFRKAFLAFIMIFGVVALATDGSSNRGLSPQGWTTEVNKICTAEATIHNRAPFGTAMGHQPELVRAWVK